MYKLVALIFMVVPNFFILIGAIDNRNLSIATFFVQMILLACYNVKRSNYSFYTFYCISFAIYSFSFFILYDNFGFYLIFSSEETLDLLFSFLVINWTFMIILSVFSRGYFYRKVSYKLHSDYSTVKVVLLTIIYVVISCYIIQGRVNLGALEYIAIEGGRNIGNDAFSAFFWEARIQLFISLFLIYYIVIRTKNNGYDLLSLIVSICVAFYWIPELYFGNRRFIPMLMLYTIVLFFSIGFNVRKAIPFTLAFIVMTLFSRVFYFIVNEDLDIGLLYTKILGEFAFTSTASLYYLGQPWSDIAKVSFFNFILFFIPRVFWEGKPESLGNELAWSISGGDAGFAFTPLAEFYINFGFIGVFMMPFLFLLLSNVTSKKSKFHYIHLLLVSFSVDIQRSESGTFLVLLIMCFSMFYMLERLSRK